MIFRNNTPIEDYRINNTIIHVKREDLACPKDCPPLSKLRGLDKLFQKIKNDGIKTVVYENKPYSMAGDGIRYIAGKFNLNAIILDQKEDTFNELEKIRSRIMDKLE